MEPKRYYRSKTDRVFAGVCGGLAEYFSIDPLLMRLLFVVLAIAGGGGILIYIILWIVVQEKPESFNKPQDPPAPGNQTPPSYEPHQNYENPKPDPATPSEIKYHRPHRGLIGGMVLITLGILFLIAEFVPCIDFGDLWPVLLVVIGIGLLIRSISGRREK